MAGLLPIQLGNPARGQDGPVGSLAGAGEPVTGFAAVLSELFKAGSGPTTPILALAPAETSVADLDPGLEHATPAPQALTDPLPEGRTETLSLTAVKPFTPAPLIAEDVPEATPSVAVMPVPTAHPGCDSSKEMTLAGDETATVPVIASFKGATEIVTGARLQNSGSIALGGKPSAGDYAGANSDPLAQAGRIQTPAEDANPLIDILSGTAPEMQLGDIENEDPQSEPTTASLPKAASDKHPGDGGGSHVRLHRRSVELLANADVAQVSQAVAAAVLVAPISGPSDQPTGPLKAPTTLASPGTTATTIGVGGEDKPVGLPRPSPNASVKVQVSDGHPVERASSPAFVTTPAEPEKLVAKSDALPTLIARTDVAQASFSGMVSPTSSTRDSTPAATPVDQIVPALVSILQKTDGQQSVTVRLQPADLGQVQIRMDRTDAGAAHIVITAERPETLQLLQREEPRLQQVLDQAGVLSTGRTVSFQVATPDQIGATASRPDSMETGAGASGQGQSGGTWRQNGDAQNDFGRGPGPDQGQNRPRWFRAGLDITA